MNKSIFYRSTFSRTCWAVVVAGPRPALLCPMRDKQDGTLELLPVPMESQGNESQGLLPTHGLRSSGVICITKCAPQIWGSYAETVSIEQILSYQ